MVQDLGIAQLLSLLGVPGRERTDGDGPSAAAIGEARLEIALGDQAIDLSRTEARLLLFLSDPIREWLDGGDPSGAESDLRWSIVKEAGGDVMEVRIGDRDPMRFGRIAASASLESAAELRAFVRPSG